jgi:hypothetical protein
VSLRGVDAPASTPRVYVLPPPASGLEAGAQVLVSAGLPGLNWLLGKFQV